MIYKRYKDADKLIVDADGLKLSDDALVLIYHEDKWYDDVLIDLEGQAVSFEKLKPYIIFAAKNLLKWMLSHRNIVHCMGTADSWMAMRLPMYFLMRLTG